MDIVVLSRLLKCVLLVYFAKHWQPVDSAQPPPLMVDAPLARERFEAYSSTVVCKNESLLQIRSRCTVKCRRNNVFHLGYRYLECKNTTLFDVGNVIRAIQPTGANLSEYSSIHMRLAHISDSLAPQTLADLPPFVEKLDLVGVHIGNFSNASFETLKHVEYLDLNGLLNDAIPLGVFDPLTKLRVLKIRNISNLRGLASGTFDRLLSRNVSVVDESGRLAYRPPCVDISITSPDFVCDCDMYTWMRKMLPIDETYRIDGSRVSGVVDIFDPTGSEATVLCKAHVVCSPSSPSGFANQSLAVDTNVTCPAMKNIPVPAISRAYLTTKRPTPVSNGVDRKEASCHARFLVLVLAAKTFWGLV